MIRLLALCALASCSSPSKADALPPSNLVCDRLRLAKIDGECVSESTPEIMHRALVNQGDGWMSCGLPSNALTVVCGPLFPVQETKGGAQ